MEKIKFKFRILTIKTFHTYCSNRNILYSEFFSIKNIYDLSRKPNLRIRLANIKATNAFFFDINLKRDNLY